jgi:hypothetical protein
VLNTLTTYLFQHKKVVIPYVGSFQLRYQPAVLHFSDRVIYSPYYQIEHTNDEIVDDNQIEFICATTRLQQNEVQDQLLALGQALKNKLKQSPFEWKGVGRLEQNDSFILFKPLDSNLMISVPAHKVVHENAQHQVRVGEDHLQSGEAAERLQQPEVKRSKLMLWIWILIGLAIAFLAFYFYTRGMEVSTSGSQFKVS